MTYRKFSRDGLSPCIDAQANSRDERNIMNSTSLIPPTAEAASHCVEFFRLPAPGKRDPYFGLSRGWYYKASTLGEIKMVAVRQRGALRGVRLVVYDSVCDYIRRAAQRIPVAPAVATIARTQMLIDLPRE